MTQMSDATIAATRALFAASVIGDLLHTGAPRCLRRRNDRRARTACQAGVSAALPGPTPRIAEDPPSFRTFGGCTHLKTIGVVRGEIGRRSAERLGLCEQRPV